MRFSKEDSWHSWESIKPYQHGVYAIAKKEDFKCILYVGHSQDVKARVNFVCRLKLDVTKEDILVSWGLSSTPVKMEKKLEQHFHPPFNAAIH